MGCKKGDDCYKKRLEAATAQKTGGKYTKSNVSMVKKGRPFVIHTNQPTGG